MTTDVKQKTAAQLTGRHLLGIEGLSVPEMQSLLYRSHYFADIITGERQDPGLQTLLSSDLLVMLICVAAGMGLYGLAGHLLGLTTALFGRAERQRT